MCRSMHTCGCASTGRGHVHILGVCMHHPSGSLPSCGPTSISKWTGFPSVGFLPHLTEAQSQLFPEPEPRISLRGPHSCALLSSPGSRPASGWRNPGSWAEFPQSSHPQGLMVSPCLSHCESICSWLVPRSVGACLPALPSVLFPFQKSNPVLGGRGHGLGGSHSTLHLGWGFPSGSGASVI